MKLLAFQQMLAIFGLGDCRETTKVGNSFKVLMKPYTQSEKVHVNT